MIKKKKGRPPKNNNLDLNNISDDVNINKLNIYPPNKIKLKKVADPILDKNADFSVYMECQYPNKFSTLLNCFKGKNKHIYIIFTKTGLIFNQNKKIENEIMKFECKIFPDNMNTYQMSTDIEVIQVEVDMLHNIFKKIPKKHIFRFSIHHKNDKIFRIVSADLNSSKTRYRDNRLVLSNFISYGLIEVKKKDGILPQYECIIMMESKKFKEICETVKVFSNEVSIICGKVHKNSYSVIFKYNKIPLTSLFVNNISKKFIFIKEPKEDIKNTYNIDPFIKYTKLASLSTIVKLYISSYHPMIIEYSLEPGLGTFQIFVQQQNKIIL